MRSTIAFMLMTCSLCVAQPSKDKTQVQKTIADIFDTFGTRDIKTFKELVTNDILIYEDGEILTLDSMVSYFEKTLPADFSRKNAINFLTTEIEGNMAWVGYDNRAEIQANGRSRSIHWLESAVLIRVNKGWKVRFLHSTPLKK